MRGVLLGHAALSGVVVGDYGGFYERWDENQQGGSGADGGGRGRGSRARRPRPLAPRPRLPQNDLCTFNQRAGLKTSGGPNLTQRAVRYKLLMQRRGSHKESALRNKEP